MADRPRLRTNLGALRQEPRNAKRTPKVENFDRILGRRRTEQERLQQWQAERPERERLEKELEDAETRKEDEKQKKQDEEREAQLRLLLEDKWTAFESVDSRFEELRQLCFPGGKRVEIARFPMSGGYTRFSRGEYLFPDHFGVVWRPVKNVGEVWLRSGSSRSPEQRPS